jgi:hypothetical protein
MSILNRDELLALMSMDKYKNRHSYMVELLFKELRESMERFRSAFMPKKRCEILKNMYLMMSLNAPILAFHSERKLLYSMYITSFQHLEQMDKMIKKKSKYVTNNDFMILKESVLDYRKNYEICRSITWGVDRWIKHIPVDLLNIISSYLF